MTPTPSIKVTPFFDAEYLINGTTYRQFQWNTNRDLHMPCSTVSFRMTLSHFSELAKYSMTRSVAQSLCDSWASCINSHGFQCSPTLNRQPCEGRLPLTSWWRKSSDTTVGQSSMASSSLNPPFLRLTSRCGWTCNQLTSKVDGGITGSRLRCGQLSPSVWPHNLATRFWPSLPTVVFTEPFLHGTGKLWCL